MRRRWPVVVLVVVVVLSVGGYAVAHSGSRRTASGLANGWTSYASLAAASSTAAPSGPTPAEQRYIDRARRQTIVRDPGCKAPVNNQRGATVVHRAPPRALLAALGVLRRRALPADRSTRMLMRNGFDAGAGVYVDYIRRTRTAFGKSYYLVPEARIGVFGPIPNRCYREMRTALKHDLRSAPPVLRKPTLSAQAQEFAAERLQARQQQGLCFAAVSLGFHGRLGGVDEGCTPGVPNVRTPLDGGIGEGDRAGGTIFAAVVPDIVGSVTVEFDAAGGNPARSIASRAVNNVVVFKIPPHTAHRPFPSRVIVRDRHGHPIPTPTTAVQATSNAHPQTGKQANRTHAGYRPDGRLVSLLAVLRRAPDAADQSPGALRVAATTHTDPRYVRDVGRGLLGGRIFLYPVSDIRDPANTQRQGGEDPGVCLITVGGLPVAGQIGGFTALRDIRKPTTHWSAGEILPGPQASQVFDKADRDHVALVVHVHHNAAYFHVNHSAPAAVYMRLVFTDAHGHIVPTQGSRLG